MATITRTRATSDAPARRGPGNSQYSDLKYDSWDRRREDVTTNGAPEWQSSRRQSEVQASRYPREQYSPAKSRIDFAAPSVAPTDSLSQLRPRNTNGREYAVIEETKTTRSRPKYYSRSSSCDGTSWSGAPLTATNLEALNDGRSVRSSRRGSRRQSNAYGGDDREPSRATGRASRRRSTFVEEEVVSRSKSGYRSGRSRRRSIAQSSKSTRRGRDHSSSSSSSSSSETEVVAAGAAAGAANQATRSNARSRQSVNRTTADETSRASRRDSKVSIASVKQSDRQTMTRYEEQASSPPSRPVPPSEPQRLEMSPSSATSASPPEDCEWERRVQIREYRRPSDGAWVRDREICIRKLYPPQAPRPPSAVEA